MSEEQSSFLILTRQFGSWQQKCLDSLIKAGANLLGVVWLGGPNPPKLTNVPLLPVRRQGGTWQIETELVERATIILDLAGVRLPPQFDGTERWHFHDINDGNVIHRTLRTGDTAMIEGWLRSYAYSAKRTETGLNTSTADWPALAWSDRQAGLQRTSPTRSGIPAIPVKGRLAAAVHTLWRRWGRRDEWSIGLARQPISAFLTGRPEIEWVENPGNAFLADPFGRQQGHELQVLAERFDRTKGRGDIVSLSWRPDEGWGTPEPFFDPGVHTSYPFIVSKGEAVFLVPETARSKGLDLYALSNDRTDKVATILEEPVVDPTLLEHDGRWYLFGTDHVLGPNHRLNIFWSDNLEGPWCPHLLNPVKIDVRSSRPAGTPFWVDGVLYRPAQDCSTGYGSAIVINQIDVLTPTQFAEHAVVRIQPYAERPDGLHTISAVGEFTLVDGLRRR